MYVLKFAEDHANQFPPETLASLREHLGHISGRVDAREKNTVNLRRRYWKNFASNTILLSLELILNLNLLFLDLEISTEFTLK